MTTRIQAHQIEGLAGLTGGLPVIDVVGDHGAVVDGITDDTAAWQAAIDAAATAGGGRIISSRIGVSIIAGALQDTAGANAQLVLPSITAPSGQAVSITIEGAIPPSPVPSVIGDTPLAEGLVLKSTLTTGSGGRLLGGVGPSGTYANFTMVVLRLRNVTFRMPSNPTHTALDLSRLVAADLDNVTVDTGSNDILALPEPTTATSYGILAPTLDNGAYVRFNGTTVTGFYNGYQFSEHANGLQITAMGCKRAFVLTGGNHAGKFQRLLAQHCQVIVALTGTLAYYFDVDQLNIEHAASTGGWRVTTADLDDPSNLGKGTIRWHAGKAGTSGPDHTFTKNGGSGIEVVELGTATPAGGAGITVQDENGTLATTVTQLDFQGAGVTAAVGTGGEVVVTIPGAATTTGGSGELLMQDGVTAPPVPLETETHDDWLYQG